MCAAADAGALYGTWLYIRNLKAVVFVLKEKNLLFNQTFILLWSFYGTLRSQTNKDVKEEQKKEIERVSA